MLEKENINPLIWKSIKEREEKYSIFLNIEYPFNEDFNNFINKMSYRQWASLRSIHSTIRKYGNWKTRNKNRIIRPKRFKSFVPEEQLSLF